MCSRHEVLLAGQIVNNRPFSPLAQAALVQAVTHLAASGGTLADRLSEAVQFLDCIRPADLDADLRAEVVKTRGIIRRGGSTIHLQRAAGTLVEILVRYTNQRPQ
jgi:hypothetical protein